MKIEELFPLKEYPFTLKYHIECTLSSDYIKELKIANSDLWSLFMTSNARAALATSVKN